MHSHPTTGRAPRRRCRASSGSSAPFFASNANGSANKGVRLEVIGRRDRIPARSAARDRTHRNRRLRMDRTPSSPHCHRLLRAMSIAAPLQNRWPRLAARATHSRAHAHRSSRHALTSDCGNVDLLIRTGGEQRLSDFLLWESAYANSFFTDIACGPTSMSPISPPLSATSTTANAASAPSPPPRSRPSSH